MPIPDDAWWADYDHVPYGPPAGTLVRSNSGRLTPASDDVQETDDGTDAMGLGAYDPVRSPGPNVAGLSEWASNGDDVYDMGYVSLPYNPNTLFTRPGMVPGARDFAPTQSVFLNDLQITRGPGHFAQPVPSVKVEHAAPAPAWGKMRPQPITRPRPPDEFPSRHRTFTRTGVFA